MVERRDFLKATGAASTAGLLGLSGCIGEFGSQPYNDGTLDFYMSPTEPQELMRSQYAPVRDHLAEETGTECELTYAEGYSAVLESLSSGTGDVAETGPFAAALGVRADPPKGEIILQRFAYGSWTYSSVIVTDQDSDIESLQDLEGKSIAFADALSASGSLFPLFMLKQAGLSIPDQPGDDTSADFDANWSGHSAAIEQLNNGQVDAAGVGKFIALSDPAEGTYKDWVEPIEEKSGIPRAPILVSPELSDEEKSDVVDAFTNAPDDMYYGDDGEEDSDDDLWFSDVRPADNDDFELVIEVARELDIDIDLLEQDA